MLYLIFNNNLYGGHNLAAWADSNIPNNPERAAGMRKLLEAKDCFVRAQIFKEGL